MIMIPSVLVSVWAGFGPPVKGFIIQARPDNGSAIRYGSFVAGANYQLMTCDEGRSSSITHTDNAEKVVFIFTWNPPSSDVGSIVFKYF